MHLPAHGIALHAGDEFTVNGVPFIARELQRCTDPACRQSSACANRIQIRLDNASTWWCVKDHWKLRVILPEIKINKCGEV